MEALVRNITKNLGPSYVLSKEHIATVLEELERQNINVAQWKH